MAISARSIEKYFEFCNENFPHSFWNTLNKKDRKIAFFKNIKKSLELLSLLQGFKNVSGNAVELITDTENYLKRILYIAPLNDNIIYSSIMRGLSESLLRIAYSGINPDESPESIRKMKYRELNETINSHTLLSTVTSRETKNILDSYGKYSNELHGKKRNPNNDIRFLSDIITNNSGINPDKLYTDSHSILEYCQKVLFIIFEINEKSLSHTDKSRLELILK